MTTGFTQQTIGGIALHRRPGKGPAVVLLHGIGSQGASFAGLIPLLPADWDLIAWDMPGYGGSRQPAQDWPLAADYARVLATTLDALDIGPVVLVGHSLGALVGAALAAQVPDRVARLLIASPALGHGVPRGVALSDAAQARIDDLERLGPEGFAQARAARLIADPEANPALVDKVRVSMAQVRPAGYAPAARLLASGRLRDDLARLRQPCDVVVGTGDVVTPPQRARAAHDAIPEPFRGALDEIRDAGHALYHQVPQAFADAILASVSKSAEGAEESLP